MTMNNKLYNVLKWIALILLPALSTLVMALGDIWGLPHKEQIALTIAAVDTFIGVLIGISTASYKGEGKLAVDPETEQCVVVFNDDKAMAKASKSGEKILLTVETVDTAPETVSAEAVPAN